MKVELIPDFVEDNFNFPSLETKTFQRKSLGNINKHIFYRYDTKISLSNDLFSQYKTFKTRDTEIPFSEICNTYGYNFLNLDKSIITIDKSLYDNNYNEDFCFSFYYSKKNKFDLPTPKINKDISNLFYKNFNIGNTYSLFKEERFMIHENNILNFINLKASHFNSIIIPFFSISYIINKNVISVFKHKPEEIPTLLESISQEGLKYPLCFYVTKEKKLYPLACFFRVFATLYLNLPSIPVCLVYSNEDFDGKY